MTQRLIREAERIASRKPKKRSLNLPLRLNDYDKLVSLSEAWDVSLCEAVRLLIRHAEKEMRL